MLPTLDQKRGLRLTTLCVLYAAQGMPDGFVRTGLKTYLIDRGVSTSSVGMIVALVSWPWALKWIWGPVFDRYKFHPMGRRRPWILAAQSGMILSLGAMALIPDLTESLKWLSIMILVANVFASMQDVSVDALAVDLLPEKERGIANGFMYGSSYLGSFIGASMIGGLLLTSGLLPAVTAQVTVIALIALFPLLCREHSSDALFGTRRPSGLVREAAEKGSIGSVFRQLAKAFSIRSSFLAGLLAIASLLAINGFLVIWPVYLQKELGWTPAEYLLMEGAYSMWFGLGGSVLGGMIASVVGTKRSVTLAVLLIALTWLAHALTQSWWNHHVLVMCLFLWLTALAGFLNVSMFSMFMGIAWPPVAATQFTAYMAMLNLSNGFGASLAGRLEAWFEIRTLFFVFTAYQLALLVPLLFIDVTEARRKLGTGSESSDDVVDAAGS